MSERMAEKEVMPANPSRLLLKIAYCLVSLLVFCCLLVILFLQMIVPFFPVLFLFHCCFWVGYPLCVRYVLKKKWFACTHDDGLALKYILLPSLFIESAVFIYYHDLITYMLIEIMEGTAW